MMQQSGKTIHDGQPKSDSLAAIARTVGKLHKFAKYVLLFFQGDADSVVANLDAQIVAAAPACQHHRTILRGVAYRIAQQVEEDTFEQHRIAQDRGFYAMNMQSDIFALCDRDKILGKTFYHCFDIDALHLRNHYSGIQLGNIQ